MADLASAGSIDGGANRLTLALLAGVLAAGALIYGDLQGRGVFTPDSRSKLDLAGAERRNGAEERMPEQADDHVAEDFSTASEPTAEAVPVPEMSPEMKEAFDTVLRGKSLLAGETMSDIDPESLREKASEAIGYALQATPAESPESPGLTPDGGMPWIITGKPVVLGGDLLQLNEVSIRLHGIRAPGAEDICRNAGGEPYDCARWSQEALTIAIGARNVSCDLVGTPGTEAAMDGSCHLHMPGRPAIDLAEWMISAGAALALAEGGEAYSDLEEKARDARRGLWSGSLGQAEETPDGEPK